MSRRQDKLVTNRHTDRNLEVACSKGVSGKRAHGSQVHAVCRPRNHERQEAQALHHGKQDDEGHGGEGLARLLDTPVDSRELAVISSKISSKLKHVDAPHGQRNAFAHE